MSPVTVLITAEIRSPTAPGQIAAHFSTAVAVQAATSSGDVIFGSQPSSVKSIELRGGAEVKAPGHVPRG
jgi:hypothetical protein